MMNLKKLILFLVLSFGFTQILPFKFYSFSTGAGKVPSMFSLKPLFNVFNQISLFVGSEHKAKCICDILYTWEYKLGKINNYVNKYFFDLDDETAMKIGPNISEFRRQRGNRLKFLRQIADDAKYTKRSVSRIAPLGQITDDASYDEYLASLKPKKEDA